VNQLFFVDPSNNEEITWNNFLQDLNEVTSFSTIIDKENYYQFIQQLVLSLSADVPITIIDGTYTATEKAWIYSQVGNTANTVPNQIGFKSVSQLILNLNKPKINWSITLFSSGTTGQPKMVKHTWETLTRALKISEKHLPNVWGLAYNPAHIAGIQVILQALLNQNTLVRLFGFSPHII
jgi:acyl-CoA synthetase (AMP-forming)/AMP-acid ligase II